MEKSDGPPRAGIAGYVLLSMFVMSVSTTCVVSPPIEPEPPEANEPPFILPVLPESELVVVNTDEITLRARLFDPNQEEGLNYAWFGEESGFQGQFFANPSLTGERFQGIFLPYDDAELELDVCGPRLRNADAETIWLYVSDRPFVELNGPGEIETEDGGYVDVWVWRLQLQPGRCPG